MGSMDLNALEKQWGCFDDDKSSDSKDDLNIKSLQSEGEDEEEEEDEMDDILDSSNSEYQDENIERALSLENND